MSTPARQSDRPGELMPERGVIAAEVDRRAPGVLEEIVSSYDAMERCAQMAGGVHRLLAQLVGPDAAGLADVDAGLLQLDEADDPRAVEETTRRMLQELDEILGVASLLGADPSRHKVMSASHGGLRSGR